MLFKKNSTFFKFKINIFFFISFEILPNFLHLQILSNYFYFNSYDMFVLSLKKKEVFIIFNYMHKLYVILSEMILL